MQDPGKKGRKLLGVMLLLVVLVLLNACLNVSADEKRITVPIGEVIKTEKLTAYQLAMEKVTVPVSWVSEEYLKEKGIGQEKAQAGDSVKGESELTVKVTDRAGYNLDARVYLDGEYRGWTVGDGEYNFYDLSPGRYELKVTKEEYGVSTKTLYISKDEEEVVKLTLQKKSTSPKNNKRDTAELTVKVRGSSGGRVDALIHIDGDYQGWTGDDGRSKTYELAPGSHDIRVVKDGYATVTEEVQLSAGEYKLITIKLDEEGAETGGSEADGDGELTVKVTDRAGNNLDARVYLDGKYRGWTLGDGEYDFYDLSPGRYEVKATKEGYKSDAKKIDLDPGGGKVIALVLKVKGEVKNEPPKAIFNFTPQAPRAEEMVEFNPKGSRDPDGSITHYRWSFGDGDSSSARSPKHKFSQPGTYEVELKVTDEDGGSDSFKRKIIVKEQLAELAVAVEDDSGKKLDTKVFLNGSSRGSTGSDGIYSLTNLASKNYSIKADKVGYHSSSVTVYLSPGEKEEITLTLEEENKPPNASFSINPALPLSGQTVTTDASRSSDSDGEIKSYTWEGEGKITREGKKIEQIYHGTGSHELTLTVTDKDDATSSITREIRVLPDDRDKMAVRDKYALVIGISSFESDTLNTKFGARDARAFKKLLLDESVGGFKDDNVTILTDEAATKEKIDSALAALVEKAGKDDLVVLYYSGPGAVGPDASGDEADGRDEYFITYGTDPSSEESLAETAYSDDRLAKRLRPGLSQGQKVILVFDKGYAATSGDLKDLNSDDIVLIGASGPKKPAWEFQELEHGLFTHYLLEGMKSKADETGDDRVSLREIYNYVRPRAIKFFEDKFPGKVASGPAIKGIGAKAVTFPPIEVNEPPSASFTYSPSSPKTGERIAFDSNSNDPDGSITDYEWRFGDGTSSSSRSPSHTYSEPGRKIVELSVTDADGATDNFTKEILIENRPPEASFSISPVKPEVGQVVTFSAVSSRDPDGSVKEYSWDIKGDLSHEGSGMEVTNTFEEAGNYEVRLTVKDDSGDTASVNREIKVREAERTEEVEIEDKYALVIGISEYKFDTVPDLKYPKQDARDFYQFLISDSYANFPKDNVALLTDEDASTQAISREMSRLVMEVDENDLVIIYYSGHGAPGPDKNDDEKDNHDEYYVTYDTDTSSGVKLYSTGIRDDQFGNWLKSMDSKQVAIFLDSCYSGGATKATKGTTIPGQKALPKNEVFNDFSFENRLLFAASEENQPSWESTKFKQGVFTHFLLKGLKGEADYDNDGAVQAGELYDYLKPQVTSYVDEHFTSTQIPLMKGAIGVPIVAREGSLEGQVKYVKGPQNDKAERDEYVVINLGKEDGVEAGDRFKIFLTTKGVGIFEKVYNTMKVIDVVGPHMALGRIEGSDLRIKKGYRVRRFGE